MGHARYGASGGTWDARLTSTLVLWLIYVSYLVLRRFSNSAQTPVLAAVLASVYLEHLIYRWCTSRFGFFRTQHPQPVLGGGGSIDPRMLQVWLINWAAFQCFGLLVFWFRYRMEILRGNLMTLKNLVHIDSDDAFSAKEKVR